MMVCMFVISMAYIEPTKVQASTSRKTYTIDVGETLDLSCIVPSCTTRVKTSDSSVASVGNIDFSLANGGWKGDFTVTGRSEGTVIVTVCGVFNNTTYETYIINVKHSFDEGVLVTTADCVTDGEKVYTCYGCAYTKVVNLGKNHEVHAGKAVLNNVKEPSCDDGYTGDTVCSACGDIFSLGQSIPAIKNQHTLVSDFAVAPSCTETGLTEGSHCTECGKVLTEQKEIPATGHTIVIDQAVEPIKTTTGLTEGSHCSVCGIVLKKQEVIPIDLTGLSHGVFSRDTTISLDGVINNDIYIERGSTLTIDSNVTVNGNIYVFGTLRNRGGLAVNGTVNALHYGTMLSAGNYDYGYIYNSGRWKVTSLNITNSYLGISVPSVRHLWDEGAITKKATCGHAGEKTYTCTECGETKTESIPKLTTHTYDNGVITKKPTCKQTGVKTYKCTSCDVKKVETLAKTQHVYKQQVKKATINTDGYRVDKCTTCEVTKNKVVIRKVNNISLSKVAYEYTNKEIKPSVIIKDSAKKAISNSQYNVSYKNNKNVGTATVIINFKGNYSGTVTKTFKINPKATTINKLTASSKGFTVAWKKQNQQTDGYQIQYATDKSFKRNVGTVSVNKNSATSQKVTKLKPKTKYYVRIRTFKKVNGSMFYSDWKTYSKVVTTNK